MAVALVLAPVATTTAGAGAETAQAPGGAVLPYQDPDLPTGKRVADLLGRMTLEEKIGQMTQAERAAVFDDPTLIAEWRLGSVLSGGGSTPPANTPEAWAAMVNTFQAAGADAPGWGSR